MDEKRPMCPKCNTPMWKKETVFPRSKNPRIRYICGQCGKTKTVKAS